MDKNVYVEQIASVIRRNKKQLVWLKSLGLGKIGKKAILKSTPEVLGLIRKVKHCLKVSEID